MRWPCFPLLASLALPTPAQASAQTSRAPQVLRFDLTALPVTRDSFVFFLRGDERGWAVWQYEIRQLETTQQLVYTARSEFRPVEEESLRVVLDRLSGAPIATFHHIDLFSPTSDTVMVEHELDVRRGEIWGRRRVGRRNREVAIVPVRHALPPGTVLSSYMFIAAAVTNAAPGDSLSVPAYREFGDSISSLNIVAEAPTTVQVPAGRFDVLPLRSGGFRVFTTRAPPRRVVKGETLDGVFSFQLAGTGPVAEARR